jgi:hypothetical protein
MRKLNLKRILLCAALTTVISLVIGWIWITLFMKDTCMGMADPIPQSGNIVRDIIAGTLVGGLACLALLAVSTLNVLIIALLIVATVLVFLLVREHRLIGWILTVVLSVSFVALILLIIRAIAG